MAKARSPRPSGHDRVPVDADDLRQHLVEEFTFLIDACREFDAGRRLYGKQIALSLRKLLYDHGTSSVSLLGQVGLLDRMFLDTATQVHPGPSTPLYALPVLVSTTAGGVEWAAPLDFVGPYVDPHGFRFIVAQPRRPFRAWWDGVVYRYIDGTTLSRKTLVLAVANNAGAHIAPEVARLYRHMQRGDEASFRARMGPGGQLEVFVLTAPVTEVVPGQFSLLAGGPANADAAWMQDAKLLVGVEFAAVRQIAHEVLRTFAADVAGYVAAPLPAGLVVRPPVMTEGDVTSDPEIALSIETWVWRSVGPRQPYAAVHFGEIGPFSVVRQVAALAPTPTGRPARTGHAGLWTGWRWGRPGGNDGRPWSGWHWSAVDLVPVTFSRTVARLMLVAIVDP